MKILSSGERKKVLYQLKEQYGIQSFPYLVAEFGKERLRLFSGSLIREDISFLDRETRVELLGLYFGKEEHGEIRLSLDAIHILKDKIKKNIFELTEEQAKSWLSGEDLNIQTEPSFKVLKFKEDFLGCGRSTGESIKNYLPKERRVKFVDHQA